MADRARNEAPEAQLERNPGRGSQDDNVIDVEACEAQPPPKQDTAAKTVELDRPSDEPPGKHKLGASIWDASLFIGHKHIGAAGSAALSAILLANIAVQGSFCALGLDHFTGSKYGDATTEQLAWWRADAHQLTYAPGGVSLVERVCNNDPTLMLGTDVKTKVAMIKDYHPHFAENPLLSGPSMVLLALTCWYATLTKELHDILNFASSMVCVPKGRRTVLRRPVGGGGVEVGTLGWGRTVFAALLVFMRLFVAGALMYVGSLRVAYTTDWGGILLNAIKLAFIVNVDELLFGAMAPRNTKALMQSLEPLRVPRARSWKGLDAWSCGTLVWVPALLVWVYLAIIAPELEHQLDAYNMICGGDRTFVHKNHHAQVIWAQGGEYKKRVPGESVLYTATHEIIDRSSPGGLPLGLKFPSLMYLEAVTQVDINSLSNLLNPLCIDTLGQELGEVAPSEYRIRHADYLRITTGNPRISDCADVAQHCTSGKAVGEFPVPTIHARRFCPLTCGCDIPGRFVRADSCPDTCRGTAGYSQAIRTKPCSNLGAAELQGAVWQSIAKQQADELDGRLDTAAARAAAGAAALASIAPPPLAEAVLAVQNYSLAEAHEALVLRLGCDYLQLYRQMMMAMVAGGSGGTSSGDICELPAYQYHCPEACFCLWAPCPNAPVQCATR